MEFRALVNKALLVAIARGDGLQILAPRRLRRADLKQFLGLAN